MYSLLLKKALPFALTFILGSLVGGLFKLFGVGVQTPAPARAYYYGYGEGHSCRMRARQRYLVAESKPLAITLKPQAYLQGVEPAAGDAAPVLVSVTFGAGGKVQDVTPIDGWDDGRPGWSESHAKLVWYAVERAARGIQFEPETINGVPVTVTQPVEIQPFRCAAAVDYSRTFKP